MRTRILQHALHGNRRPVERCEQPDRPVVTRKRGRGRTGRLGQLSTALIARSPVNAPARPPGRPTAPGNRVPGGDTGRTKLPNPRAPPVLSDAE